MKILKPWFFATATVFLLGATLIAISKGYSHKVFVEALIYVVLNNLFIWLPLLYILRRFGNLSSIKIYISSIVSGTSSLIIIVTFLYILFTSPTNEIERELHKKSIAEPQVTFKINNWETMLVVNIGFWLLNGFIFVRVAKKPLTRRSI